MSDQSDQSDHAAWLRGDPDWADDYLDLIGALEAEGVPDSKVVVKFLRMHQLNLDHPLIRNYLADYLEGKTKRKGRPRDDSIDRILRDFKIQLVYLREYSAAKTVPRSKRTGTPSEEALVATTKVLAADFNIHLSTSAVKQIVSGKTRLQRPLAQPSAPI